MESGMSYQVFIAWDRPGLGSLAERGGQRGRPSTDRASEPSYWKQCHSYDMLRMACGPKEQF